MRLIVISGLPATGKTTLGKEIARRLSIPFFSKDTIKERLFDERGFSDRAWSKKLGMEAYEELYRTVEHTLNNETDCVIESNFKPGISETDLRALLQRTGAECRQIFCHAPGHILMDRFERRAHSGERHPGHVDAKNLEEFRTYLTKTEQQSLDLIGHCIHVDTTDLSEISVEDVLTRL